MIPPPFHALHGRLALCLAIATATIFPPLLAGAQPRPQGASPPATPVPSAPATTFPGPGAPPSSDPPTAQSAVSADERKKVALELFNAGLALYDEEAWSGAAVKLDASYELFHTRNALKNAAYCYKQLQRYDDALDRYETLLRDYLDLTPEVKSEAQAAVSELRGRVGYIDVSGAEPGASVRIGEVARGEFPLLKPVRVPIGEYEVTVFKEGFEPFKSLIKVSGGKTVPVEATLTKLSTVGPLKILEQDNRTLEVLIDETPRGMTPWEGVVSVGHHVIALREGGTQGRFGTGPVAATAVSGKLTTVSLHAEELDSSLRVEPEPGGANVIIDGVDVGVGGWRGRLRSGKHTIDVRLAGYETFHDEVVLTSGGIKSMPVELEWLNPGHWFFQGIAGLSIWPIKGFGGETATSCGTCGGIPVGFQGMLHAGFQFGNGIGVGVQAGGLYGVYAADKETAQVQVHPSASNEPLPATVSDSMHLTAVPLGAFVSFQPERLPALLRVGVGGAWLHLGAKRTGSLDDTEKGLFPIASSGDAGMLYLAPEIHLFKRFGSLQVSMGLQLMVGYIPSAPRWQDSANHLEIGAGKGEGSYQDKALMGPVFFTMVPSLGFRYGAEPRKPADAAPETSDTH